MSAFVPIASALPRKADVAVVGRESPSLTHCGLSRIVRFSSQRRILNDCHDSLSWCNSRQKTLQRRHSFRETAYIVPRIRHDYGLRMVRETDIASASIRD